jgi:hypothetical protein
MSIGALGTTPKKPVTPRMSMPDQASNSPSHPSRPKTQKKRHQQAHVVVHDVTMDDREEGDEVEMEDEDNDGEEEDSAKKDHC